MQAVLEDLERLLRDGLDGIFQAVPEYRHAAVAIVEVVVAQECLGHMLSHSCVLLRLPCVAG
jgi:hypothetical protein